MITLVSDDVTVYQPPTGLDDFDAFLMALNGLPSEEQSKLGAMLHPHIEKAAVDGKSTRIDIDLAFEPGSKAMKCSITLKFGE